MHSCISSSSIPAFRIIAAICSRSSSPAHQDKPHPAEIALGTGMIRPGTLYSLQAFSIAIASAVVWNVTTNFNSFFLISTQSPLQNIRLSHWQLISYHDPWHTSQHSSSDEAPSPGSRPALTPLSEPRQSASTVPDKKDLLRLLPSYYYLLS